MAETWWKISIYNDSIRPVEVTEATDKTIVINGRRHLHKTHGHCYFPTWQQARDEKLRRVNVVIKHASEKLADANKALAKIAAMEEPKQCRP